MDRASMMRTTPAEVAPLTNCSLIPVSKEFLLKIDVVLSVFPGTKEATQQGMTMPCALNSGADHAYDSC